MLDTLKYTYLARFRRPTEQRGACWSRFTSVSCSESDKALVLAMRIEPRRTGRVEANKPQRPRGFYGERTVNEPPSSTPTLIPSLSLISILIECLYQRPRSHGRLPSIASRRGRFGSPRMLPVRTRPPLSQPRVPFYENYARGVAFRKTSISDCAGRVKKHRCCSRDHADDYSRINARIVSLYLREN